MNDSHAVRVNVSWHISGWTKQQEECGKTLYNSKCMDRRIQLKLNIENSLTERGK